MDLIDSASCTDVIDVGHRSWSATANGELNRDQARVDFTSLFALNGQQTCSLKKKTKLGFLDEEGRKWFCFSGLLMSVFFRCSHMCCLRQISVDTF